MSFRVCHSYSEIVSLSPCFGSPHRSSEKTLLVSKSNLPFGYLVRNSDFQVCNHDVRKSVICSNLMPQRLNGFYLGNKQLEEPSSKLNFVKTLLIDNYDSYTYNIYQELSVINGIPPVVVRNDEWTWEDACYYLYEKKAFHNIVISPGPGSPTCATDIGICLQLLLKCKDIPILGVCLGHQALGYVHGARVVHAPEPVHGRLSEIEHTGCRLFQDIPSGKNSGFKVVRYHSLVVDSESLPRDLLPIAWTLDTDTQKSDCIPGDFGSKIIPQSDVDMFSTKSENGIPQRKWTSFHSSGMESRVLMGIMHSTRPHYGLQFHPESIATCHGRQIFNNFREMTVDYWLRSSSSSMRKQKAHHAACMQVAFPKSNQSVNGLVEWSQVKTYNAIDSLIPSLSAKFLRLSWKKFDHLAAKVGGARNIFCELFGQQKAEDTFWLDSSSTEKRRARFSFMGGRGGSLWKQLTFRLSGQRDNKCGGYLSVEDAQGFINTAFLQDGFFDFLKKELRSFCYIEKEYEGLPFDFHGGYIGYIGYDLKAECSMASNCHRSTVPEACLFFVDHLVVVDHYSDDVYILSLHDGRTSGTSWLDAIEQKLLSLNVSTSEKLTSQPLNSEMFSSGHSGFRTDRSREQYMEDIKKCLSFIRDGESYELCLTTQMRKRVGNINTLELYLNLREQNPAPYAAWLNFSKENLSICCSSPERFLQLDRYGNLEAKPIKGTIARGLTQEEDEQLKLQLQYSEKDRAENLMIVDLLRNDLGRVCEPGSVHVPRLMEVESYTTVHTMVSTIRGKKLLGISPVDCVKAAFPGGSMTGAPKLRSMELLDSLETCSRGIYSGCIGFFSYDQTFDLNIVIRTVVIHEGEATIGAGGAIVALSDPQAEYDEMILKTQAPTSAVVGYQNRVNLKSS